MIVYMSYSQPPQRVRPARGEGRGGGDINSSLLPTTPHSYGIKTREKVQTVKRISTKVKSIS
jgi:hypothetical protein